MFERLVESSDTPLPIVAALGAAAAVENDVPRARLLLRRVVDEDPKHAVAWNNYAWALSREPETDLPKALEAANQALELVPDEFRFRETRGQILLALERWQEAVDDLEFALNGMPDMVAIHASLATAYEHLGQTELAAIHRQQVQ
jgi:predicted Zn-dependent protease